MDIESTIIAISSPPGCSARGLIRLSGPDCKALLGPHARDCDLSIRGSASTRLVIGELDIPVLLFCMPAPASYTTEDVVEVQLPGNPLLLARVVDAMVESGVSRGLAVRHAIAGEFTYRAWHHGRLSLDRAEGVAAIIAAESEAELDAARHAFKGGTGQAISPIAASLAGVLSLVEAGIDFADEEDVVVITAGDLASRLGALTDQLAAVAASRAGGEPVDSRCRVVLRGPANAGKSTLFNALLGRERVVTHDEAGTTRDAIVEPARLGGQHVLLVDTPGDDDGGVAAAAEDAHRESDVIVWCEPPGMNTAPNAQADLLVIHTKRDLRPTPGRPGSVCAFDPSDVAGLADLIGEAARRRRTASNYLGMTHRQTGLAAAARHGMMDAIEIGSKEPASGGLTRPAEVAALLRLSLDDLGAITGTIPPDDVLGLVFAGFCIGK
jgi:tRNA modification GTPase